MLSLRGLQKGLLGLSPAELGSHKCLTIINSCQSRGRPFLRDYAVKVGPKPRKRTAPIGLQARQTPSIEALLPPLNILKLAYKAEVLKINPKAASEIIRRYHDAWASKSPGWEKRFLEEEKVKPETLTTISLIMNRSADQQRRAFATQLLHTASSLGDTNATLFILNSALRSHRLDRPIYGPELARLNEIAKSPIPNPSALLLLGRIHESRSKPLAALQCFRKAASISSKPDNPTHEAAIADALIAQGRLLLSQKDDEGAHQAFRKAALDYDSPEGYFHLAVSQPLPRSTREEYLLKAASSGIVDAPALLGSLYTEESEIQDRDLLVGGNIADSLDAVGESMREASKTSNADAALPSRLALDPKKRMAREMGKEWLALAAAGGDRRVFQFLPSNGQR